MRRSETGTGPCIDSKSYQINAAKICKVSLHIWRGPCLHFIYLFTDALFECYGRKATHGQGLEYGAHLDGSICLVSLHDSSCLFVSLRVFFLSCTAACISRGEPRKAQDPQGDSDKRPTRPKSTVLRCMRRRTAQCASLVDVDRHGRHDG